MTSSPQYNIGAIGGFNTMDWNTIMSNPYFLMAANSPNVNFKGGTDAASNTNNAAAENTQAASMTAALAEAQAQQSEGVSLGQGVLAVALLGAGAYALIKGHKSGYLEKLWKKVTGKTNTNNKTTTNTVLQQLAAIKNGNGEIKLMVPNKTTTFAGKKIQPGVNEYGIQQAVSESRQAFNPEVSALKSFHVETPTAKYTVFTKDGEITKVVSSDMKKGENVLERLTNTESGSSDAKNLEKFKKITEELGKKPEEVDKSVLQGVTNIRYSNQYGDDTLNMVMKNYNYTPKLQSIKTLEQFDKTSETVKAYVPSASEEAFTGEIVNQKGGWLTKKGVLADGFGVLECNEEIVRGTRCFFEGDKLVKIEQVVNGKTVEYAEGSFGFRDFIKTNEKAIENFKNDVFVKKIASKIPKGAKIGAVQ